MAQQINLFDPALQRRRDPLALANVVLAGVVLASLVGVAGMLARNPLPALQARVAAGDSQLRLLRDQVVALGHLAADRKPDPRLEGELAAARRLAAGRGEVLQILRQRMDARTEPFAAYLHGLARQSLTGLWITAFAFDADSGSMEIRGGTVDPALLPEYIRRLNREPAFQGRAFSALKLAEGKPAPPADKAAPAARAPYHEFMLIPVRAEPAGQAQSPGRQP